MGDESRRSESCKSMMGCLCDVAVQHFADSEQKDLPNHDCLDGINEAIELSTIAAHRLGKSLGCVGHLWLQWGQDRPLV